VICVVDNQNQSNQPNQSSQPNAKTTTPNNMTCAGAGATFGSKPKPHTEQHSTKLNQFFEDQ